MKKLLNKFYLPLLILLINGAGSLYAHTGNDLLRDTLPHATLNFLESKQLANAAHAEDLQEPFVKTAVSNLEKLADRIDPTDTEDEDESAGNYKMPTFKKFAEAGNYFTAVYNLVVAGTVTQTRKNTSPDCEYFSYFSSEKYLVYRVLRI